VWESREFVERMLSVECSGVTWEESQEKDDGLSEPFIPVVTFAFDKISRLSAGLR
jgi:hypothetical protein